VRQLVTVRDLPNLRRIEASKQRGHAIGSTVLDLLEALGRSSRRFPTIGPNALLAEQVRTLTQERDALKGRLNAARQRIDALIQRLPHPSVKDEA